MKRILMLEDFGLWARKGRVYDVSNERARGLCKTYLDFERMLSVPYRAVVVEDLGIHIGRSRHVYERDGPSRASRTMDITLL